MIKAPQTLLNCEYIVLGGSVTHEDIGVEFLCVHPYG